MNGRLIKGTHVKLLVLRSIMAAPPRLQAEPGTAALSAAGLGPNRGKGASLLTPSQGHSTCDLLSSGSKAHSA